jgi:predicted HTH transcriptional regulator
MSLHETNRIEYKEKLTADMEQEAVAFLNSEGGDIFIGIRKDGSVAGVANPDQEQLKIADRLRNNIRPNIMGLFDISTEKRDGKDIIIINFASGTEKPYCIKQKGYSEAGCFIRVGSSSQPMPQEMIDKMLAKRHPLSLANMPSRRQDLTFDQLKLFYGLQKKPLNDNFAQSLDFLTADGKYNMVAYLFADNNNISVRVGKYSGTDKDDLIGREDFKDCCLITAMKKVLDRFDIENTTQSKKRPMKTRIDTPLVDEEVLHEVIINAFAHNDYSRNLDTPIFQIFSDRFEITSFGGLVDGLTLDKFYTGTSMPRNREIVRVFKDLDYVEQLGNGIPKIVKKYGREAMAIDGFVVETTLKFDGITAGLKTTYSQDGKTTDKILANISDNPMISISALAGEIGITPDGVKWHLDKLKKQGIIKREGAKNGGHWKIIENKG